MGENRIGDNERVEQNADNEYLDLMTGYDYQEENAAEISEPIRIHGRGNEAENDVNRKGMGYIALALAILSLFFSPILFGGAALILGFVARNRGAEGLGNWAIGIGAVSVIIGLFIAPFF